MSKKLILDSDSINQIIEKTAKNIFDNLKNKGEFAIVGIQTRGVELAERLRRKLETLSGKEIKNGILDITFFRDDLATRGYLPAIKETRIEFDINGIIIILADDVLFTGRTVKAALETLTGFGRPKAIKLFAFVDRGNRELPIQPDYCGYSMETDLKDEVQLRLKETDNVEDSVYLIKEN
ncbi:MAG: bifunctional pyr operon transcriptional regulator/uracil phosphoribosyltransferase PyrR [Spirochaetes bacterium]|nr:bifunctional pyr operon transcriptional regulator/uracil phosphoribosyltransferase PyrR [Spirochaetota bacterium]